MNPQLEHVGPRVERVGKEGDQVPSPLVGHVGPLLLSLWGTGSPFRRLKGRWGWVSVGSRHSLSRSPGVVASEPSTWVPHFTAIHSSPFLCSLVQNQLCLVGRTRKQP